MAAIKKACARSNRKFGLLGEEQAAAIEAAADELGAGSLSSDLLVDVLESSGGTPLHINVNEVLANRVLQLLGHDPGDYERLHPNDHMNCSQSTNDVVPSAINMARRKRPPQGRRRDV